jgi:hypothetical protein
MQIDPWKASFVCNFTRCALHLVQASKRGFAVYVSTQMCMFLDGCNLKLIWPCFACRPGPAHDDMHKASYQQTACYYDVWWLRAALQQSSSPVHAPAHVAACCAAIDLCSVLEHFTSAQLAPVRTALSTLRMYLIHFIILIRPVMLLCRLSVFSSILSIVQLHCSSAAAKYGVFCFHCSTTRDST